MTTPKEATREALPADLEALMPEPFSYPVGDVTGPCACGSWPGGKCLRCAPINFFTADQMREAIRGATERAARKCEERATAYRTTRAPGWHEVDHECTQCAAAIRSGGEAGS